MPYNDLLLEKVEKGYILGKRWKVVDFINNGGCAAVYLVADKRGNHYAAKLTISTLSFTLGHEYEIYKMLRNSPYVPKLPRRAFGYDSGNTYMIMQLLGNNLRQYRRNFPEKQIPLAYISALALQMIDFLEFIHSKGYIYLDVKPENFLLAREVTASTSISDVKLYCADFGLSQRYICNGKHRPFKIVRSRVGTLNFMSIHAESRSLPSRRDDIESMAYVLIFLQKGGLPWEYAYDDAYGLKMKRHVELYISNVDHAILELLYLARRYTYEEEPDYSEIRNIIHRIGST
jgi:serine/threonine protein kinase